MNTIKDKMYMPGRLEYITKDTQKCMDIINSRDALFIANITGHIPSEHINEFIKFLPIFSNINITTVEATICSFMYDYCKKNKLSTDKSERKLTQLANITELTAFSSYYLWYLMDRFHFTIDTISEVLVFTNNTCFNGFVTDFMDKRQKAEL